MRSANGRACRLKLLLDAAGMKPNTRYVVFHCADDFDGTPYYESIDLIDAYHPQTILAWGMNDQILAVGHGAPLRLRVERQLGYKQAKYVMRIEAVERLAGIGGRQGRLLGRFGRLPMVRGDLMESNMPLMKLVLAASALAAGPALAADPTHPTVIELFESQGCSDCPPANANLNAIADRADLLALNFAVIYWDQLGWKDTFATPGFTAPPNGDYAHAAGRGNVFTPQMIVNGRGVLVGSSRAQVEQAIHAYDRGNAGPAIHSFGRQGDNRWRFRKGSNHRLARPL